MKILALEFASPVRAVAVIGGEKPGYAEESDRREMRPFFLIDAALGEAGLTRDEIECLAIGLGPGSNAGVRTAIAIAQGWQLARGTRVLGISSAEVVAARATQSGVHNPVLVGIEVRRGELWVVRYDVSVLKHPKLVEPFHPASAGEAAPHAILRMDSLQDAGAAGEFRPLLPRADFLALLATGRTDFARGDELEPVSLRPVQFVKAPPPRHQAD